MRVLLFANTDWFLYNFKLSLAESLRAHGHEVILLSPPGPFGEKLRALGFRWESFPLSRSGINPLRECLSIVRLRRCYAEWQPEVVHHFTIKCVIYGSLAARRAGVRRIVNSVTGLGFALLAHTLKARFIRPVVLALYRLALRDTQVVFQNADNRDVLARHGVLVRSRVALIPGDGIDIAHFRPAEAAQDAPPVVLMMCRLLHSKGVREFVEAAGRVRAQMPQVRFLLAGEPDPGNPESVTTAELAAWREHGDVECLGHREDVLALQQGCTLAVLASTQGEGMPRSLLEAAACGKPLVTTRVPGCRELVAEGENGVLVPPGDAQALADAILGLLQDGDCARRMGLAARARVEAMYANEVINAQTLALYTA